jgi:hypothetical protein
MAEATKYIKVHDYVDDEFIVGAADEANEVAIGADFDAVASVLGGANGIPAIYTTTPLTFKAGILFNGSDRGIDDFKDLQATVFNLAGYGALGDGSTDDAAAFTTLLTDVAAAKDSAIVLIPPTANDYRIKSTIDFSAIGTLNDVTFLGMGETSKIVIDTSDSSDLFDLNSSTNIIFDGIYFGSGTGQTGGNFIDQAGSGCGLRNCRATGDDQTRLINFDTGATITKPFLLNVRVDGDFGTTTAGDIIRIDDATGAMLNGIYMNITAGTSTSLILITGGTGSQDTVFGRNIHLRASSMGSGGALLKLASGQTGPVSISGFSATNSSADASGCIDVSSATSGSFVNGYVGYEKNNAGNAVSFEDSTDCSLSSVQIVGNDGVAGATSACLGTGWFIHGATRPRISNSHIAGFNNASGFGIDDTITACVNGLGVGVILENNGTNNGAATGGAADLRFDATGIANWII